MKTADDTETTSWTALKLARSGSGPVITIVHHDDPRFVGTRYALEQGESSLILGRSSRYLNGLTVDTKISRKHLRLSWRDAETVVQDLGSHNGTWVDGEKIAGQVRVTAESLIRLGDVWLTVADEEIEAPWDTVPGMVGRSTGLARVGQAIGRCATQDAPVLILGETGVGKEQVAQAVHRASQRSGRFVPVNCGAIPDELIDAELFGAAQGIGGGAAAHRLGLVGDAHRGTLFLDHVSDATPALQRAILNLIEGGGGSSAGKSPSRRAQVRVVASTLPLESHLRSIRGDLRSRLETITIRVPPLRERRADITPLALHFVQRQRSEMRYLGRDLVTALLGYSWPGNVRELKAIMHLAVNTATVDSERLPMSADVERELAQRRRHRLVTPESAPPSQRKRRPKRKRPPAETLVGLLTEKQGSVAAVARHLGVERATVYRWSRYYQLDLDAYRSG